MVYPPGVIMFDANDRKFMRKALALAERAMGLASPNPTVGCVVVRDGKILGRGWHEYALRDHAEVRALRESSGRARGSTVYVTLEPCCHQGRTPACVDRLIQAGIQRVVIARIDPNPKVCGRGAEQLRSAGIRVDTGLMTEQAGKLIESFACRITTGLPLVVCKIGMSLDGKIGAGLYGRDLITSPEGREFGQLLRHRADAILVGIGTVLSDNPELTYRGAAPKARSLVRVILDAKLRTPPHARLFRATPRTPILIFCKEDVPQSRRKQLQDQGAEIASVPCCKGELDLKSILKELGARDLLGLLVEGGSQVHWSFLSGGFVDTFYFIIAPFVLGGKNSVPSVGGNGYESSAASPKFRIRRCFSAGPDLILETYPSYSRSIISPWLCPESTPSGERDFFPALGRK